jgi:hypothetical protein
MSRRPSQKYRPGLERLEAKRPLSASPAVAALASLPAGPRASAPVGRPGDRAAVHQPRPPVTGVTMDRITNPHDGNSVLTPPFQHVVVQTRKPVPGQVYNVLFLSVWNGTKRTFHAGDGLTVKISNQTPAHAYPILSGAQEWKPGQRIVFYLLSKKYYPLSPTDSAGFEFNFVNPRVVAIPGPSGIFLRVKYNPATFDRVLDSIVVNGPGAYGHLLGIPDTAIWEIIPAGSVIPL